MNNFSKRLVFGILYVILIVLATTTNHFIFYGLFFAFMLFSVYEFLKMIKLNSYLPYFISVTLFFSIILKHENFFLLGNILSALGLLLVFSSFIIVLFNKNKNAIEYLGKITLTLLYTVLPFLLLIKLPFLGNGFNPQLILGIFILTWSSDTFAYLVGRQFGKHKLFERISPKKTIEGFAGGVFFTLISAYIISIYFTSTPLLEWLIIAVIISVFGVLGDLIESMFKRQAQIKDSSQLIPGHGGFLDRLDSIIFATPFIYGFIFLTEQFNL